MPDPFTATVGLAAGSQVIGGIGANKQAKKEMQGQQRAIDLQERIYDESQARLKPGVDLYDPSIQNLMGLLSNNDVRSYDELMKSNEYNDFNTAANRNILAAMAGKTGTGQSNVSLATVAPMTLQQLRTNDIQDRNQRIQEALLPINIAQSATGQTNTLGQNFANTQGQNLMNMGRIQGAKAAIPFQVGQGLIQTGLQAFAPQNMGGMGLFS